MKPGNKNSYKSLTSIEINQNQYNFYSLKLAEQNGLKGIEKLPKSLKVLLENLLRYEDGKTVTKDQILALQKWLKDKKSEHEAKIDLLCNPDNLLKSSEKILFTQRFYYLETFLFGDNEKIKSELFF